MRSRLVTCSQRFAQDNGLLLSAFCNQTLSQLTQTPPLARRSFNGERLEGLWRPALELIWHALLTILSSTMIVGVKGLSPGRIKAYTVNVCETMILLLGFVLQLISISLFMVVLLALHWIKSSNSLSRLRTYSVRSTLRKEKVSKTILTLQDPVNPNPIMEFVLHIMTRIVSGAVTCLRIAFMFWCITCHFGVDSLLMLVYSPDTSDSHIVDEESSHGKSLRKSETESASTEFADICRHIMRMKACMHSLPMNDADAQGFLGHKFVIEEDVAYYSRRYDKSVRPVLLGMVGSTIGSFFSGGFRSSGSWLEVRVSEELTLTIHFEKPYSSKRQLSMSIGILHSDSHER